MFTPRQTEHGPVRHPVAKALYDNVAEAPDELAFRKGDVLAVLEQNTAGLEGWWLCYHRGRQGICPANRLRLMPLVYDVGALQTGRSDSASPPGQASSPSRSSSSSFSSTSSVSAGRPTAKLGLLGAAVRANQQRQQEPARSQKQLAGPIRQGEAFACPSDCYDEPRALRVQNSTYQSPRPLPVPVSCEPVAYPDYDVPRQHSATGVAQPANSEYDVPRASADVYDVPSGRYRSSHATDLSDRSSGVSLFSSGSSDASCGLSNAHLSASSESLSLSSAMGRVSGRSSRSSVVDHNPALELYDVPVQRDAKEPQETYDVPKPIVADVYDVPRGRDPADVIEETYDNPRSEPAKVTLPLALDAAMETLSRLDAEVSSAVTNVLASPPSEPDWAELQLRVFRLRGSLQELCDFARGAIGNAAERIKSGAGDEGVGVRLARLLGPLHNANGIVQRASHAWTDLVATSRRRPDSGEFEQLVACCGSLGDDARQVVSFIRANGRVLFTGDGKRASSADDYDYVSLESKAKFDEDNEEVKRSLPHDMKGAFDVLVAQSEDLPVLPSNRDRVSDNDRNVIEFYGSQAETYTAYLTNAIHAFILTIERNQPPKVFVAYSKFVILNAHKLLCIGDTVHRNVSNVKLKASVLERSNQLCQGLQTCVQSTKRAGREFPSVPAVQGMLDSVLAVSRLAQELKACLVQPIIQK